MPITKTELFKSRETKVASAARALSHPARVAILRELARRKECVCGEIVEVIPLAQATVSQHLRALRDTGFIKGEIDGARSCYCIDGKNARELVASLQEFLGEIAHACCEVRPPA